MSWYNLYHIKNFCQVLFLDPLGMASDCGAPCQNYSELTLFLPTELRRVTMRYAKYSMSQCELRVERVSQEGDRTYCDERAAKKNEN
jgi:hypothetical protein